MVPRLLVAVVALVAPLAAGLAPAGAAPAVSIPTRPVAGNPADAMRSIPMDLIRYDAATRCSGRTSRGVKALTEWLETTRDRGESWGSYRCEKWSKSSASLHAEGRAEDWHLDVTDRADRAEAEALIRLLLAPDKDGNPQALAARMGVEELIWDCHYWSAGATAFRPYSPCYDRRGRLRKKVDPTAGHRNHIHIGLTRTAARLQTSFWREWR